MSMSNMRRNLLFIARSTALYYNLVLPVSSSFHSLARPQNRWCPQSTTQRVSTTASQQQQLFATTSPNLPNFCENCGSDRMVLRVPEGDERERACCESCNHIVYVNPKVVVACVIRTTDGGTANSDETDDKRVLLAKRSIEPRLGYWGIPQGFMEIGETSREGACREAKEEVGVTVMPDDLRLRAIYNVPGSVQVVYEALVDESSVDLPEDTLESSEIQFFSMSNLPDLCFPTVQWALDHCCESSAQTNQIHQKTKMYNPETEQWSESEDFD